jgi:hypothetical protein
MNLYSKQEWFCNNCGRKMFSAPCNAIGRRYIVCSTDCHNEMQWKDTLSIMGKDYYPQGVDKETK